MPKSIKITFYFYILSVKLSGFNQINQSFCFYITFIIKIFHNKLQVGKNILIHLRKMVVNESRSSEQINHVNIGKKSNMRELICQI